MKLKINLYSLSYLSLLSEAFNLPRFLISGNSSMNYTLSMPSSTPGQVLSDA